MADAQAKHSKWVADRGEGRLARVALRCTESIGRWLPDAFGLVVLLTFAVLVAGLFAGEPLLRRPDYPAAVTGLGLVDAWGKGFWGLTTFTLQVVMVVAGGYAVVTSRPVAGLIARLAQVPRTPRGAVVFVAVAALASSYLSWAVSLVFAAILAKEVARNVPDADYRALGAMTMLGFRDADRPSGLVPLADTRLSWHGVLATLVVFGVAVGAAWLLAPGGANARTAADLGIDLRPLVGRGSQHNGNTRVDRRPARPGDWLEYSPVPGLLVVVLGVLYLARHGGGSLTLNTVNLAMFGLALLLHWRPWRMVRAVREGAAAVGGVLLLFPLYGGIGGMVLYTGLASRLSSCLLDAGGQVGFAPMVAVFSCVLGVLVPGGGSSWASYVFDAANRFGADAGWAAVAHDLGVFSAFLVQPFWMLPALALLGLKARDVMGFTVAVSGACLAATLVVVTLLAPHVTG